MNQSLNEFSTLSYGIISYRKQQQQQNNKTILNNKMFCVWNEDTVFGKGDDKGDDDDDSLFLGPQDITGFATESAALNEESQNIQNEIDSQLQHLKQHQESQERAKEEELAAISNLYQSLRTKLAASKAVLVSAEATKKFIANSENTVVTNAEKQDSINVQLNKIKLEKDAHIFATEMRQQNFRTTATSFVARLKKLYHIERWSTPNGCCIDGYDVSDHAMSIIWIFVCLPVYLTKKNIYLYLGYRHSATKLNPTVVGAIGLLTEHDILVCKTDANGEKCYYFSSIWSNSLGRVSGLIQPGSDTSKYADAMKRFKMEGLVLIKKRLPPTLASKNDDKRKPPLDDDDSSGNEEKKQKTIDLSN
jgi:hypothetical protein